MSYFGTVPGPSNVFIPDYIKGEAGTILAVNWARNPKAFAVGEYSELRPVKKRIGLYPRISPDMATRVLNSDAREAHWRDGAQRPNTNNNQNFLNAQYSTERYNVGAALGDITVEQAEWLVDALQTQGIAQNVMTIRTILAGLALSSTAWGNNSKAVNGGILTGGQDWTTGSRTSPNIKKTILKAMSIINLAVGGALAFSPENFCLVMNPDTASYAAGSAEIYDTPAQSQFAMQLIKSQGEYDFGKDGWGLPTDLYGVRLCVDRTVYNSVEFGNTNNPSMGYVIPTGTAYLLYRPKGKNVTEQRDGNPYPDEAKIPALSTLMCFSYEDFTVEQFVDIRNRITEYDCVTDVMYQVSSPLSGMQLTACTPNP